MAGGSGRLYIIIKSGGQLTYESLHPNDVGLDLCDSVERPKSYICVRTVMSGLFT